MDKRKRPVIQMLEQLEDRYYVVTPIIGSKVKETIIQCKHCNYTSRHADEDHEQAQAAAQLFLAHLRSKHKDLLKKEHEISIDRL